MKNIEILICDRIDTLMGRFSDNFVDVTDMKLRGKLNHAFDGEQNLEPIHKALKHVVEDSVQ